MGVVSMCWAVWSRRNYIVFFYKSTNYFIYAGYVQRFTLDEDMSIVPKGGGAQYVAKCMLSIGYIDNGDHHQLSMEV